MITMAMYTADNRPTVLQCMQCTDRKIIIQIDDVDDFCILKIVHENKN